MTYFGFLLLFLVLPVLLIVWGLRTLPQGGVEQTGLSVSQRALLVATGVQVVLAVLYTTPWDNYLVATGVWNYGSTAVTGILLGYVPIEEYTFFVLEAILVGAWWSFVSRGLRPREAFEASLNPRVWAGAIAGAYYGYSQIPKAWLDPLENGAKGRDYVVHCVKQIVSSRLVSCPRRSFKK